MAATMPFDAEAPRPPCVRPQGRVRPCVRGGVRGRAASRRESALARKDCESEVALVEGCDTDEEVIDGCSSNFMSNVFGTAMEELLDDDEWLVSVDDATEEPPAESVERRAEMQPLFAKPSVGTWLLQKPRGLRPEPPAAQETPMPAPAAVVQPLLQHRPSVGTWLLQKPRGLRPEQPGAQETPMPAPAAVVQPLLQHRPSVGTWLLQKPRGLRPEPPGAQDAATCSMPSPTGCPVAFGPRPTKERVGIAWESLSNDGEEVPSWDEIRGKEATAVVWEDMGCEDSEAPTWDDIGRQENCCSTMPKPATPASPPLPAVAWESLGNDADDLWEACVRQQEAAVPVPAAPEAAAVQAHVAAPADAARAPAQAAASPTWSRGARRLIFRDERLETPRAAEQAAVELPVSPAISQRSRARLLGTAGVPTGQSRQEQPPTGSFVSSKRELKMLLASEDALDRLARPGHHAPSPSLSAMEMDLRAGSTSSPNPAFSAAGLSMTSQVPMLPNVHKKAAGLEGTTRTNHLRLAGTGIVGGSRTWGVGGR